MIKKKFWKFWSIEDADDLALLFIMGSFGISWVLIVSGLIVVEIIQVFK